MRKKSLTKSRSAGVLSSHDIRSTLVSFFQIILSAVALSLSSILFTFVNSHTCVCLLTFNFLVFVQSFHVWWIFFLDCVCFYACVCLINWVLFSFSFQLYFAFSLADLFYWWSTVWIRKSMGHPYFDLRPFDSPSSSPPPPIEIFFFWLISLSLCLLYTQFWLFK